MKRGNVQLDHTAHEATADKLSLCLLAHDLEIPMNVGSIFRIADALGVERIYLTGNSAVPPDPKIKKTSRAAERHVPYAYELDPLAVVAALKNVGYKLVSLEITTMSLDIAHFSVPGNAKVCLILGSETHGVSQELLDISDATIHIPMRGQNSSMNVACACAIATYHVASMLSGAHRPELETAIVVQQGAAADGQSPSRTAHD